MSSEAIKRVEFDMEKIKSQKEDDLFYFVDNNTVLSERITAPRYSYWKSVFRIFFKNKLNWVILVLLLILFLCAFILPAIYPYVENENVTEISWKNLTPWDAFSTIGQDIKWILGTDYRGNSIFVCLWSALRTSLGLSLICAAVNMTLGIAIGALWGYSKVLDGIFNVIYNIVGNVPYILLISIIVRVMSAGFGSLVFALTITGWLGISYFFRNQVLIIRDREYNLASRTLGTNIFRIVGKNVLPYLTSVIVTLIATEIPAYISMEVYLGYIGIGLPPGTPSIGQMIHDGQDGWTTFPWPFWVPVIASSILAVSLYVMGQNLADASDPRSHMQ